MNPIDSPTKNSVSLFRTLIFSVGLVAVAFSTTWAAFGKTMVEKLATELLMPVGLIWMMLIIIVGVCFLGRQRAAGFFALVSLVLLSVAGNSYVSNALVQSLEQPYIDQSPPAADEIDIVILLGGGATTDLRGTSQLASSGDRVAAAARYYTAASDAGASPLIVCTGSQVYRSNELDLDPNQESKNNLIALGVPEKNIQLLEADNTSQEMRSIKRWLDESAEVQGKRVGILTSAWHLPRAMRLAKAEGIEATPMPSDFRSQFFAPKVGMVVPTVNSLQVSSFAIKEMLAGLVKR